MLEHIFGSQWSVFSVYVCALLFRGYESVFFPQSIEKEKEKSILHTHAAHLQEEEREFTGETKCVTTSALNLASAHRVHLLITII